MSTTRIFAIFDPDHDRDLYDRLVADSGTAGLGILVSGGSEPYVGSEAWREYARNGIRAADRVLVLCGEHTEDSVGVASEFRMALEEGKLHLLLWGRRDLMCTKPVGAKAGEGMYTWTLPTLQERLALMARTGREEVARVARRSASPPADPGLPAS